MEFNSGFKGLRSYGGSLLMFLSLLLLIVLLAECCQIGVSDFCRHVCRRRAWEYVPYMLSADRRKIEHNLKFVFVHFSCLM